MPLQFFIMIHHSYIHQSSRTLLWKVLAYTDQSRPSCQKKSLIIWIDNLWGKNLFLSLLIWKSKEIFHGLVLLKYTKNAIKWSTNQSKSTSVTDNCFVVNGDYLIVLWINENITRFRTFPCLFSSFSYWGRGKMCQRITKVYRGCG